MILSVGEVLWDYIGNDKLLGGSPLNVSYYISRSFKDTKFISRIGNDTDGYEIINRLKKLGLNTDYIQIDDKLLPTGKVIVKTENNKNTYHIVENVAWDNIVMPEITQNYDIVFSSLAQRNKISRETVIKLVKNANIKFFDANLRFPYTTMEIVNKSIKLADIVKINDEELEIIYHWYFENRGLNQIEKAFKILEKYYLKALVVTLGENGSFIITPEQIFKVSGIRVNIKDTVGCGDSFFGTLIAGYLNGLDWQTNLNKANQVSAEVASIKGAIL